MAQVNPKFCTGIGNQASVKVISKNCQHFDLQAHQGQIVRNIPANSARVHPNTARIGVARNQQRLCPGTNIHIHTAYSGYKPVIRCFYLHFQVFLLHGSEYNTI